MMSLTWYILGLLTVAAGEALRQINLRYHLNWIAWCGLTSGVATLLFCIAWVIGAYLEGVPRAAAMGMLVFGFGGIILLAGMSKYIALKLERRLAKVSPSSLSSLPNIKIVSISSDQTNGSSCVSDFEKQLWKVLGYLAYVTLFIAFVVGITGDGKDYEKMLQIKFPEAKMLKLRENPTVFQIGDASDGNYAMIQEGQGYGGPLVLGIRIMKDAKIHNVVLLDNKETPAFLNKIERTNFSAQYVGKHVTDNFLVDDDIEAVTGATISTRAATMAVRNGAHTAATEYFKLQPTWEQVPWNLHLGEVLVILIFGLAFFKQIHKSPWKYIYMVGSLAIVGFYMNASMSISSLSGLLLGFIPSIKEHLVWWVLVIGSLVTVVLLGRNIYCYRICPFFWVQWILSKIGGNKLKLSVGLQQRSRYVANLFLWAALMIIFLSSYPGLGNYEPFAMMFSIEGDGVQWYILPMVLIGSFFISSFWCRFFCPVGNCLTHLLSWRSKLLTTFSVKETSLKG